MTGIPDRLAAALADRYRLDLKHDRRVAHKVLRPKLPIVQVDHWFTELRARTAH
jgi:hypothetical protein